MKFVTAAALMLGLGVAGAAQAAPLTLPTAPSPGIENVMQGCGPYGHRDRYGYCRPNGYRPRPACPPGWHLTPYGCRRNW